MENNLEIKIAKIAKTNAIKLKNLMAIAEIKNYYMAGGCFQKTIHDYDVFPVNKDDFNRIGIKLKDYIVFASKNAFTVQYDSLIVQFCKYHHASLKNLVDSFDFAHCQIGAKITDFDIVDEVYCSNNYINWKLTDEDEYVGSEYPLSSLMRSFKYKETFLGKSYKLEIIKILVDMIKRGFEDYEDFKDQLDAIDLAFVEINKEELLELFNLLKKNT